MKNKINLVFESSLFQKLVIGANIRTCINATLKAEGITIRCEINVLVTDDVKHAETGIPAAAPAGWH